MSNFRKFVDYITDSVRPVQQNSIHSVGIKDIMFKNILFLCTMPLSISSICYYLSLSKF